MEGAPPPPALEACGLHLSLLREAASLVGGQVSAMGRGMFGGAVTGGRLFVDYGMGVP